jgi:hypothetical protein
MSHSYRKPAWPALLWLTIPLALAAQASAQGTDDLLDDLFADDGLDSLLDGDIPEVGEGLTVEPASPLRAWKGFMEAKPRYYSRDRDQGRNDEQLVVKSEFEMDFQFGDGLSAFFRPRIYVDLLDGEADRFEPYEAYASIERKGWDLRVGQFVENWGIVDTFNPIDVINRRDRGTDFLETDRLGEMGVRYQRYLPDSGAIGEPTISMYALPVWQATPFPENGSRFGFNQPGVTFDEDGGFEPDGFDRGMYATRFQSTMSTGPMNADVQFLAARGPDRSPGIALNSAGALAPAYYGSMTTGFGLRAVPNQNYLGEFLSTLTLKAEVIHRSPYSFDRTPFATPDDYWAFVFGVDRSFYDVLKDQDSLTLTVEYAKESGADDPTALLRIFQNDLILRGFWEANDFARTSFELRGIFDLEKSESVAEAIFERQLRALHEDLKLTLQFQHFDAASGGSTLLGQFPNNSSVAIGLRWDY